MFRRSSSQVQRSSRQPAGKPGGHGDHWGCIFRRSEQQALLDLIKRTVESDSSPTRARQGVSAYMTRWGKAAIVVLVEGRNVASAYPEVLDGPVWPVTVSEVTPWANGIEGQITGNCMDARVSFFDTRFYANRETYMVGAIYNFSIGALAYRAGVAEDLEAENELGVKVSFKGACAYMPAALSIQGADIDDYWFHSPLEDSVQTVSFGDRTLTLVPITLAIPGDFEMRADLLAAEHALEGLPQANSELVPGATTPHSDVDLQGFLWLQGHLVEK